MNGKELIKKYEGCKLEAYLCPAKIWTIGWGATFYKNGDKVKKGEKITQAFADDLFEYHYGLFEASVKKLLKVELNENQLGALVSFAFNLGVNALGGSTLLKKVNAGDFDGAAAEFKKWVYANKVKLPGLEKRRNEEMNLFITPVEVKPVEVQNITEGDKKEIKSSIIKLVKGLIGKL